MEKRSRMFMVTLAQTRAPLNPLLLGKVTWAVLEKVCHFIDGLRDHCMQ